MKIQWLGEGSVRLQDKGQRVFGGLSHVWAGGSLPKFKEGDLVFLEYPRTMLSADAQEKLAHSAAFVIDGAGEYSYQDVTSRVKAVTCQGGGKTHLISLNFAGMVVVLLSGLDRELDTSEIDFVGTPDVLVIPVGGNGVMNAKQAVTTLNTIQPRVVIPTYTNADTLSTERADVSAFAEEYAVTNTAQQDAVTLKPKDLPSGTTETYLLEVTR